MSRAQIRMRPRRGYTWMPRLRPKTTDNPLHELQHLQVEEHDTVSSRVASSAEGRKHKASATVPHARGHQRRVQGSKIALSASQQRCRIYYIKLIIFITISVNYFKVTKHLFL